MFLGLREQISPTILAVFLLAVYRFANFIRDVTATLERLRGVTPA